MKSASAPALPSIGSLIAGRYRIERVVGQGGMGVVYAARHIQLNELVAVKMLHPKVALDEQSRERFLREARACVKIKNEHVVKVIDVFTGEGSLAPHIPPYMLMEFLVGEDLGVFVRSNGPMPITMAVDYLLQAAEAIAEAHSYGIVHRDIKPANLLLTQRSDGMPLVKVLDFGISKAVGTDEDAQNQNLTATAAVFGSPTYMSPEQVRSSKHVDARADVWSLGVVLFEMLSNRVPFGGESMSGLLASIVADPPRSLREVRPDAPEGLQAVIAACLEKNRDRRVQSVGELATLLKPFASPLGLQSIDTIARLSTARISPSMRPPLHSNASSAPVMAFGATERSVVTNAPTIHRRSHAVILAIGIAMLLVLGVTATALLRIHNAKKLASIHAASSVIVAPPTLVVAPPATSQMTSPPPTQSAIATNVSPQIAANQSAEPPHSHASSTPGTSSHSHAASATSASANALPPVATASHAPTAVVAPPTSASAHRDLLDDRGN